VIPDAAGKTLVPIIERKVTPDSIVYSLEIEITNWWQR